MIRQTLARLLAAWRRIRWEAEIIQIDREIDCLRSYRVYEQGRERELDQMRAEYARRLQAMAQDNINRQSRDNVRALVRK